MTMKKLIMIPLLVRQLLISICDTRKRTLEFLNSFVGGFDFDKEPRSVDREFRRIFPSLCRGVKVADDTVISGATAGELTILDISLL